MARTILVAGTASHVGKSTVAAGLCRLLADRDVEVAPYKAQNMSNNARAVGDPDGTTGEIGVSQYVQARAARVPATTDHNPVLLKPRGDGESQLVLQGEAVAHYSAGEYYADHWDDALAAARESHARLAADHDVIVAEGAGSIAEPNLRDRDLANVETARFSNADILLVADIERGGVFASLVGTIELMPDDLREQVAGAVITKFRGDRSLLAPGIAAFEERTGVPTLGVLPYDDPGLPEEDSVSLPSVGERAVHGGDDGVPDDRAVTVAVPRLPRASNMTDLEPLAREPGVRVGYLPLDASLETADAVVLPGTKNTVDDLRALREAGFGAALSAFNGPVVGLCGGYQLLGERITNAGVESTDDLDSLAGFGLLPVETRFEADKQVEPVTREFRGVGPLSGAAGAVTGYEIHMGRTRLVGKAARPFPGDDGRDPDGAATDRVLGTYLHGLFENRGPREAFVETVFAAVDRDRPSGNGNGTAPGTTGPAPGSIDAAADRAAALLTEYVDLSPFDP
ncbi:cobyric acid synthase [Halorientalis pallida]|uniref:Probable cobyric acid synthase n=1 Tax=Halorientalis pallida TaxID=2479928 RepID=A0A498KSU1_9EURY|nr:cobyric acid synthase [Halorientalis pallida]RXK46990.1 cobyric acid synthase [Halorientalis pallida]